MPFPDENFDGVSGSGQGAPPDPSGEAGPNHYVQGTNEAFAIFTKNGTMVFGPAKIGTLWEGLGDECETRGKGDPVILYDQLSPSGG